MAENGGQRTARRSRREQITQRVKSQEDKPTQSHDKLDHSNLPEAPPSPIAEWLLKDTPRTWARLQTAASLGRLTKGDLQAALMAQLRIEVRQFAKDPEGFELHRKAMVNRHRLLRSLLDVVKQTATSGPTQLVRIVWPSQEMILDRGEDVRLEAPLEPN